MQNNIILKQLLACTFMLLLSGCAKKEQPVTKAETTVYIEKVKALIKNKDTEVFGKILDVDIFADEVAKAVGSNSSRALKGQVKQVLQNRSMSSQMYSSMGKDGLYELVKQYEKEGHQHVIFRMYGEGGLNYHDYELVKYDDKVNAKDMYIYLTGENLSHTLSQMYSASLKETSGSKTETSRFADNLARLRALFNQKNYAGAKAAFDQLPAALQKEKQFQLIKLQITSEMDNDTYTKALAEFETLFRNDASAQLPLFDYYFLRADYTNSLRVINQLDSAVQDPLLDYYRSLIYTQMKDDDKAVAHLEKLYQKMPYFETGVLELMANYIEIQRYEETNTLIASYKKNKSFDQNRLNELQDLYPDTGSRINW